MPAKFNGDADSGDRDDRHAPVQGDDDATIVDPSSEDRDDDHAPVQDDDFVPADGVQGDGGAPASSGAQDDVHAPVADDDGVPVGEVQDGEAGDGEPHRSRQRRGDRGGHARQYYAGYYRAKGKGKGHLRHFIQMNGPRPLSSDSESQ